MRLHRFTILLMMIIGIGVMLLTMSMCLKAHQSNLNDIINSQTPPT